MVEIKKTGIKGNLFVSKCAFKDIYEINGYTLVTKEIQPVKTKAEIKEDEKKIKLELEEKAKADKIVEDQRIADEAKLEEARLKAEADEKSNSDETPKQEGK